MPVKIRNVGNVSILDVEGNIDINSSDIVEAVGWLVNNGKLNIICNLSDICMVDYSGLSVLAIAYKKVVNNKGKMKFLKVPLPVRELFKLVRLDVVFEIYTDEQMAVKSFMEAAPVDKLHLRRKFKRLAIHIKVKYRLVSNRKAGTFEGEVLNVSGAGIFIYAHDTFPLNSQLELELELPEMPKPLKANAIVAWVADKEIQPHSYPGMGVAFSHLDADREKLIADFVDKNIIHRAEPG